MTDSLDSQKIDRVKRLEAARAALDTALAAAISHARARQASPEGLGQHDSHGLAWLAAYASAIGAIVDYGLDLHRASRLTEVESLLIAIAGGEYFDQIIGGLPMSQSEFMRARDILSDEALAAFVENDAVTAATRHGNTRENRARLVEIRARQTANRDLATPIQMKRSRRSGRKCGNSWPRKSRRMRSPGISATPIFPRMFSISSARSVFSV